MKQTVVEWLIEELNKSTSLTSFVPECDEDYKREILGIIDQAKQMEKQQKKDAYQHGRDDENCALSDGAMAPDYDNADEWYQGEYGGDK